MLLVTHVAGDMKSDLPSVKANLKYTRFNPIFARESKGDFKRGDKNCPLLNT